MAGNAKETHKHITTFVKTALSMEVPDCHYPSPPVLVKPKNTTTKSKKPTLYLSNLDGQYFLRFALKYLYLYSKGSIDVEGLKASLARTLEVYYPLAGRLRSVGDKLEVDCNDEGALFVEATVAMSAEEFIEGSGQPNASWTKLLYEVEGQDYIDVPPLIVQVTHLNCGGLILCIAISHSLVDATGYFEFVQAWSHFTAKPDNDEPPIPASHCRRILEPRVPPRVESPHPLFSSANATCLPNYNVYQELQSQTLKVVSITFNAKDTLSLKNQCAPLACTSFDALASHVWRNWIRSLGVPSDLQVKLLFSKSVRKTIQPEAPVGFYGNAFVFACAATTADDLINSNLGHAVECVKEAKKQSDDEYVKSMVDLLEENPAATPDLMASLVLIFWCKFGLENLDFGGGKPIFMGTPYIGPYCIFLPVVGDVNSFTVQVGVPTAVADEFERNLRDVKGTAIEGSM